MMIEYDYLKIVFENVESIVIPAEQIEKFTYGELTKLEGDFYEYNSHQSDHIELIIKYYNESDLHYSSLDYDEPLGMFIGNPTSNNVKDRPNVLGRILNFNDIVDIQLLDKDEKEIMTIYVPWGEGEYDNELMTKKVENGLIHIEIK
jgi:hypothetical protein